jgi:hypothetical protein
MYQRTMEDIASKRPAELRADYARAAKRQARASAAAQRKPIRTRTGWAMISIGLRLASSGNR